MRRLVSTSTLIALAAFGCETTPEKPDEAEPAAEAPTETTAAEGPVEVDLESTTTYRYFVTAAKTSLCPTKEGAKSGDCGNSGEFADSGYVEPRGAIVQLLDTMPEDGVVPVIRFMKPGPLRGWVVADDVAETPDLRAMNAALIEWKKLSDGDGEEYPRLETHPASVLAIATDPSGKARAVPTLVVEHDTEAGPAAADTDPPGELEDADVANYVVESSLVNVNGLKWVETQPCLVYGDCAQLSYVCDDLYCDSVGILIDRVDEEERIVGVADRFGVFQRVTE